MKGGAEALFFFITLVLLIYPESLFAGDDGQSDLDSRLARVEKILDTFSLDGFIRFRGNSYNNFDLDRDLKEDNHNDFIDLRGWITLNARRNNWTGVISLDLAGDDFNDGAILGNDDPGKNRPMDVSIRHLYIDYDGSALFRLGRQPGRLGHGIVSNIVRDIIKVGWRFNRFSLTGVYVKGEEGITQSAGNTPTSRRVLGDPSGDDHDLDAYGVVVNTASLKKTLKAQLYAIRKFDTTETKENIEHLLIGLSTSGSLFEALTFKFEVDYMGGRTNAGTQGTGSGERADINAALFYLDGAYNYRWFTGGAAFGLGTGDNNPDDKVLKSFQNFFIDETGFHYTYLFSDDIHGYDGRSSDITRASGFANITWAQLHLRGNWGKLSLGGSYTYITATRGQLEGSGPLGTTSTTSTKISKDVGHEVDADISYQIIDAARVYVMAGTFFPGDVYGEADTASKAELAIEYRF